MTMTTTIAGETLFLLTGVYITYCIRNARREIYKEKWTLCSMIYLELVISTVTYVLRHIFYQSIHPDLIFLLYFARCQLTVTLSLILLLLPKVRLILPACLHCRAATLPLPSNSLTIIDFEERERERARPALSPMPAFCKQIRYRLLQLPSLTTSLCFSTSFPSDARRLQLWYHNRPQSSGTGKSRSRYFSACDVENRVPEAMKLHSAVLSNGELDIADINLADMDPEEIRSELRRIYTQFQILKNKTMRKDNPHISKRRGGRKGTHRRFSLQPFSHKPSSSSIHHATQQQASGHGKSSMHEYDETEISRTPEESTASAEGTAAAAAADAGSSGRKPSGPPDDGGREARKKSEQDSEAGVGAKSRF